MDMDGRKAGIQNLMKIAYDAAMVTPIWVGSTIVAMQKNVNSDIMKTHHIEWRPCDAWLSK